MVRRRVALAALCLALLSSIHNRLWLASPALAATSQQGATASAPQLDALSGEYTDSVEPDTPISFYAQDGKLVAESERLVPTPLTPISATEFGFPSSRITVKFTLDAAGHGASVEITDQSGAVFRRTGDPAHHLFHDYQRTEVMIPMRDGVKLHAIILKPADIATPLPFLIQRTPYGVDFTSRASFFDSSARARARRLHLRGRGHSRTLQERRRVCHEPPHGGSP